MQIIEIELTDLYSEQLKAEKRNDYKTSEKLSKEINKKEAMKNEIFEINQALVSLKDMRTLCDMRTTNKDRLNDKSDIFEVSSPIKS